MFNHPRNRVLSAQIWENMWKSAEIVNSAHICPADDSFGSYCARINLKMWQWGEWKDNYRRDADLFCLFDSHSHDKNKTGQITFLSNSNRFRFLRIDNCCLNSTEFPSNDCVDGRAILLWSFFQYDTPGSFYLSNSIVDLWSLQRFELSLLQLKCKNVKRNQK